MSPDLILTERQRHGLSRRELAVALNAVAPERSFSVSLIYMWETGRRNPDPYSRWALETVFDQLPKKRT